jgi:hypothetical protein
MDIIPLNEPALKFSAAIQRMYMVFHKLENDIVNYIYLDWLDISKSLL